jgi:hypothetical protein
LHYAYRRVSVLLFFSPLLLASCQSDKASDANLPTPLSEAQTTEDLKTLDELYLDVAKQIPGFAGLYEGNDGILVAKVVPNSGLTAQQVTSDNVTVDEVKDAIIEVMGTEVFTGVPNDLTTSMASFQTAENTTSLKLRLEATKYTFEQLYTWLHQIAALNLDGVMIYDANEGTNTVYLGVETQAQADATKNHLTSLSIPHDAVVVEVVGPFDDLVLRGEELEAFLAQRDAEAPLETAATTQYVNSNVNPLVGGAEIFLEGLSGHEGYCTYGFSAKRNGVLGFVTNSHCTRDAKAAPKVTGDTVKQDGPYDGVIGYEIADPTARVCGAFWNLCRYADAAFFRNTGTRLAAPQIAGTGPDAGDKSYTYTSVVKGTLWSTKQNEHYIAVTARTGFTRIIINNTCTYLRFYGFSWTVECGATATPEPGYPYIQSGDSGSPVILRDSSGAVLVGQVIGGNPLAGTIWLNNAGGIWRDLGDMTYRW